MPLPRAACFAATVLTMSGRAFCASMRPLAVYIYSFGSQSCTARLGLNRSAPLAAAKQAAHGTLFVFGGTTFVFHRARRPATARSRLASRVLHPPSAARYVVGGTPPSLSRLHLAAQFANQPRGSRSCSPPPPRSRLHLGSGGVLLCSFLRGVGFGRLRLASRNSRPPASADSTRTRPIGR